MARPRELPLAPKLGSELRLAPPVLKALAGAGDRPVPAQAGGPGWLPGPEPAAGAHASLASPLGRLCVFSGLGCAGSRPAAAMKLLAARWKLLRPSPHPRLGFNCTGREGPRRSRCPLFGGSLAFLTLCSRVALPYRFRDGEPETLSGMPPGIVDPVLLPKASPPLTPVAGFTGSSLAY